METILHIHQKSIQKTKLSSSVLHVCARLGDDKRRLPPKTVFVQVKRCPACHYPIEKNGGCPHMTCSRCNKQFCWLCRADWPSHSYSHCRQVPEIVRHTLVMFIVYYWVVND